MPDAAAPRLLVVDDEPLVCELVHDVAAASGYDVHCGATPDQVVEEASAPFDVALVDLHLGEIDVLDVLATLAGVSPRCAVVLMTGSAETQVAPAAAWARSCGLRVVTELQKPVRLADLRAALQQAAGPHEVAVG